ncbi:VWA domain-containing protein [Paenarthrobacter sp. NPDC092416]|uniref:vWA domain-containing protein n=1 Tax=Paenarthrobacter sp. NPDC092416 TaxID=3364386 RepID=UPI00381C3CD5
MELMFWWILPLAALTAALAAWLHRRSRPSPARAIAHGERLTGLPEYQRAARRYRTSLIATIAVGSVFLMATATAAARPVQRTTLEPEKRNRDIVLCLDVSGSMTSTDAALAGVFHQLAREFDGERIGMVIFDSSSVQLFPLTDDYNYVVEQLASAKESLDDGGGSFFDGTWNGGGSSLIGDGLASCVQSFTTEDDTKRSRSVVLATDNFVSGESIFTLEQAGTLAQAKGVKVHALNPSDFDDGTQSDQPGTRLRAVAEGTGGTYHSSGAPDAVPGIVQKVQESEATSYQAAPSAIVADAPAWPLFIALLAGAGMLVLGWRVDR